MSQSETSRDERTSPPIVDMSVAPCQDAERIREPFLYKPLDYYNDQIRVMELLPALELHSTLRVRLRAVPFTDDSEPQYEALSYVWGSIEDPCTVLVSNDDATNFKTLQITRNCDQALRYLRRTTESRILWVDAICINQRTHPPALVERGRQVAMMGYIYERAAGVTCWLGPESTDSHIGFEWMTLVSSHIAVNMTSGLREAISDDPEWTEVASSWGQWAKITPEEFAAVTSILCRQYFERLWIWQEARFGAERASLRCGESELPWPRFCAAISYLCGTKMLASPTQTIFFKRAPLIRRLVNPRPMNLQEALGAMRQCKCGDQRDRVYTAQSFDWDETLAIKPDYSKTIAQVWTDCFLALVKAANSAVLLVHTQRLPTAIEGLPSWVPDWSQPSYTKGVPYGAAHGNSRWSIISADQCQLCLHGIPTAKISKVAAYGIDETDGFPRQTEQDDMLRSMIFNMLPRESAELHLQSLCRVLSQGSFGDRLIPPDNSRPTLAQVEVYLLSILRNDSQDYEEDSHHLARNAIRGCCNGRALFETADGRLGLGPYLSQPADHVVVLLGSIEAFILRQVKGDEEQYQVVGDAYCEGVMTGEAILGALPQHVEQVWVSDLSEGVNYTGFRYLDTGEILYDDPRFAGIPLPRGWEAVPWEGELSGCTYFHKKSGEEREIHQDPRCDAKELIKRGVDVREFALV